PPLPPGGLDHVRLVRTRPPVRPERPPGTLVVEPAHPLGAACVPAPGPVCSARPVTGPGWSGRWAGFARRAQPVRPGRAACPASIRRGPGRRVGSPRAVGTTTPVGTATAVGTPAPVRAAVAARTAGTVRARQPVRTARSVTAQALGPAGPVRIGRA